MQSLFSTTIDKEMVQDGQIFLTEFAKDFKQMMMYDSYNLDAQMNPSMKHAMCFSETKM